MSPLTKIFMFAGVILLGLLTAAAGYSYSQIRAYSLPISQVLAILAVILPSVTAASAQIAYRFLSSRDSLARPVLYTIIFSLQLIYETIIATLSLTYIVPNCGLEEQWARLYTNKEGDAIRRIQDRFSCCGLNSAVDRAWPFPHGRPEDGYGADQCRRTFGRDRPCSGPWRQAEQSNAGLLLTVAIVIFVVKFIILIVHLRNNSSWVRLFRTGNLDTRHDNHSSVRLMLDGGNQVTTGEEYHDNTDDDQVEITASRNCGQSTVQPSGLAASGDIWRHEA